MTGSLFRSGLNDCSLHAGVVTAYTGKFIRLMPAATIAPVNLELGLGKVLEVCHC